MMTEESEREREAIVAWLREEAAMRFRLYDTGGDEYVRHYNHTRGIALEMAADALERGDHLNPVR